MYIIPNCTYHPGTRCFGYICRRENLPKWYYCREDFRNAKQCHNFKEFLFSSLSIDTFNSFCNELQDMMKLNDLDRFSITPTDKSNIVLVKPSEFWYRPCTFDFMTAFFKNTSIEGYDKPNSIKDIFERGWYFNTTKAAVKRFLEGHTEFTLGDFKGWVVEFNHKSEDQVSSLLK